MEGPRGAVYNLGMNNTNANMIESLETRELFSATTDAGLLLPAVHPTLPAVQVELLPAVKTAPTQPVQTHGIIAVLIGL